MDQSINQSVQPVEQQTEGNSKIQTFLSLLIQLIFYLCLVTV